MAELTERDLQEAFYAELIETYRHDSAHSELWWRADCRCQWYTEGSEPNVELAAYDHISEVHMLGLDKIAAPYRADERAKVATEIADAIEADSANDASETPDWYAAMNNAADIARQHALQPAETAAAGREGTPASDSVQGDPKPAETLSGRSGAQEAQG